MLYGVGKKGKRILLSEYLNLTVQIPFGVAFEKNETENLKLNTRTNCLNGRIWKSRRRRR